MAGGLTGGTPSPAHQWNFVLRALGGLLPLALGGAWVCVRRWRRGWRECPRLS